MEKDKLPPIPTPASQRWREFRIQVLPLVVFVAAVVAIVMLWKSFVQPVGVVGIAETNAVNVVATQDGLLAALTIERFENVVEGQQIGQLVNTDPELLKAQIASAQADVEVLRQRNEVDKDRGEQSFQQFRQSFYALRFDQANDLVNWGVVSNEYERVSQEFKKALTSLATYELAKGKLDTLSTNILERAVQIGDLRKTLEELQSKQKGNQPDAFERALEAKAHELDLMLKPTTLKAPISGMVSFVHHRAGERVLRGMPLVTITDPRASRIIGYIRQPIQSHPTTNDMVQITTRTVPRQIALAPIVRIGAQLEPINPALLSVDTKRMEAGLPIVVGVPNNMALLPGEYIDLSNQESPEVTAAGSTFERTIPMPTYEYLCEKCGHEFELSQSMSEPALTRCPKNLCAKKQWGKGKVKKLIGLGAGLIFKGSGFYITDYRSEGYKEAAKKESDAGTKKSDKSDAAGKPPVANKTEKSAPASESKAAAKSDVKPAKPAKTKD